MITMFQLLLSIYLLMQKILPIADVAIKSEMLCLCRSQTGKYKTLEMLVSDLDLMFDNAKTYNVEESRLHKVVTLNASSTFS